MNEMIKMKSIIKKITDSINLLIDIVRECKQKEYDRKCNDAINDFNKEIELIKQRDKCNIEDMVEEFRVDISMKEVIQDDDTTTN